MVYTNEGGSIGRPLKKSPQNLQVQQLFLDGCWTFCIFMLLINNKIYATNTRCNKIFRALCAL